MTATCDLTPHYFGTNGYWHWCLCWTWTPLVPSQPFITTCPPKFLPTRSQHAADGMIKSCLSVCWTTSSPEQREIGVSCAVLGCGYWCQRWSRENNLFAQTPAPHHGAWLTPVWQQLSLLGYHGFKELRWRLFQMYMASGIHSLTWLFLKVMKIPRVKVSTGL